MAGWDYLDLADFLLIAEAVTGIPAAVLATSERVISQADSALHVPVSGFAGVEAYPSFSEKAAILCARIVQNHPLPDGNKRAGFLCLVEFAERNARPLVFSEKDTPESVAGVIVALAAHEIGEREFVRWVEERLAP